MNHSSESVDWIHVHVCCCFLSCGMKIKRRSKHVFHPSSKSGAVWLEGPALNLRPVRDVLLHERLLLLQKSSHIKFVLLAFLLLSGLKITEKSLVDSVMGQIDWKTWHHFGLNSANELRVKHDEDLQVSSSYWKGFNHTALKDHLIDAEIFISPK